MPRTFVVIVQDKSGSMASRTEATISGFNEYKNTLRREAEGEVLLTLTQFDTGVHRVHSAVKLSDVPDLNRGSYVAGGLTALHDAVGQAVRDTEHAVRKDDKVLVVVMTDGGENASREWKKDGILTLFERKRADGWEFVFLGAGEEAWAAGHSLGFDRAHSINYGAAAHSHNHAYAAMSTSTLDYLRGTPLAASMTSNALKAELENEAANQATGSTNARATATYPPPVKADADSDK